MFFDKLAATWSARNCILSRDVGACADFFMNLSTSYHPSRAVVFSATLTSHTLRCSSSTAPPPHLHCGPIIPISGLFLMSWLDICIWLESEKIVVLMLMHISEFLLKMIQPLQTWRLYPVDSNHEYYDCTDFCDRVGGHRWMSSETLVSSVLNKKHADMQLALLPSGRLISSAPPASYQVTQAFRIAIQCHSYPSCCTERSAVLSNYKSSWNVTAS